MKTGLLVSLLLFVFAGCTGPSTPPVGPLEPVIDLTKPLQNFTGYISDPHKKYGRVYWRSRAMYQAIAEGRVPDTYDSRALGCQMPIKDQKSCGSCWSFGSTTVGEINYCIQTGDKSPQTSPWAPQAAVSCDTDFYGCGGGLFTGKFTQKYGFFKESDWPYTSGSGNSGRCDKQKLTTLKAVVKPESFVYIGAPDRSPTFDEVTTAIFQRGAVAVSFGADNALYTLHSESDVLTRCAGTATNHLVAAVGFNRLQNWLQEQNSWGVGFGAQGYFKIAWGCNHTSEDAGYFVFKGTPGNPPKIHLPVNITINAGDDVTLAVKAESGVTYEWFQGTKSLGVGSQITVVPTEDTEYRLIAKNQYGEAEVMTLVTLKEHRF